MRFSDERNKSGKFDGTARIQLFQLLMGQEEGCDLPAGA
jgi:hypothetical protein